MIVFASKFYISLQKQLFSTQVCMYKPNLREKSVGAVYVLQKNDAEIREA